MPEGVSQNLRSHRVAIGLYDRVDGAGAALVRRDRVELDVTGAETEVPKLVGVRRSPTSCCSTTTTSPTPRSGSTTRSLATVIDGIGSIRDSLPRALCWSAAWDMTRDAEMPARDYVRLVLSGIEARPTSASCSRCWPRPRWRCPPTATRPTGRRRCAR